MEVRVMENVKIKRGNTASSVPESFVRTRDLETLLHLSKTEMKYIETIAKIVQLDRALRTKQDNAVRDQRNRLLHDLRQHLSGARVDRLIDRIAEINGA